MHTTWRNPNASKSQLMLDAFSHLNAFLNRVQGCSPTRKGAESDHVAVILKIHINELAFKMKDKKLTTKNRLGKIMNDETTNVIYNKILQEITKANDNNDNTQGEYTSYFKNLKRAGEEPAMKTITPPMDWFERSKDKIQPQIETVTSILKQLRKCKDKHTKSCLQKEPKLANKIPKTVTAEAKESYMSKLAEKIARLAGTNSKAAWKAVHKCKLGNKINHKKTKNMVLKQPNGQRAKTDKKNMSVFCPHCIRIFNNHRFASPEALVFIKNQEN
jgi:hypothetical protein